MTEASEEQIAALQERIGEFGRAAASTRALLVKGVVGVALLAVGVEFVARVGWPIWLGQQPAPTLARAAPHFWRLLPGLPLMTALGLGSSLALIAFGRRQYRRQLRRELAMLSPNRQAEVLLPLRSGVGDTRRLVEPLLRELRIPGEPIPSDAPTGRGDEPTP